MVNQFPRAKRDAQGIFVNKSPRAKREAEGSWSTNNLERGERLKKSWSTNYRERSERLKRSLSRDVCPSIISSEARDLKDFGQLIILSRSRDSRNRGQLYSATQTTRLRGLGQLINVSEVRVEAQEVLVKFLARTKREFKKNILHLHFFTKHSESIAAFFDQKIPKLLLILSFSCVFVYVFMCFRTGLMMIRNGCEENKGKIIVDSHSDRKEYTSLLNLRL